MYQDGVCRLNQRSFSKCIEFSDTNYQLAQPDDRTATFEYLCDLYNYVDASIHVQFSFVNRRTDPAQYARSFEIAPQGDDFDDIRAEYTGILQRQLTRGNNGIVKTKYLTFTIEADNLKAARARLERIETDLLGYFKMMGAAARAGRGRTAGSAARRIPPGRRIVPLRLEVASHLRPVYQGLHRPVLPPLRQQPGIRHERQVRRGELPANPRPGAVRRNAGGLPQHGKRHCCQPPCAGH